MGFGFTNLPLPTKRSKQQKPKIQRVIQSYAPKRVRRLKRKEGTKVQHREKIESEMREERKSAVGEVRAA
jgi:hypothetical protein